MAHPLFKYGAFARSIILSVIFLNSVVILSGAFVEYESPGNQTDEQPDPLPFAVSDRQLEEMITSICASVCPNDQNVTDVCSKNCRTNAKGNASAEYGESVSIPTVLCRNDSRLTVKWKSDYSAAPNDSFYLVELFGENALYRPDRAIDRTTLIAYNVTDRYFSTFFKLSEKTKYFARVTSFSAAGDRGEVAVSGELWTLAADFTPAPVPFIWQDDITVDKYDNLESVINWEPAEDLSCFYDVVAFDDGKMFMEMEKRIPGDTFAAVLFDMVYDTNYTVSVTATTSEREREAPKSWFSFKTMSCMEAHNDFKICVPPKPEGLTATEDISSENSRFYDVTVSWTKPELPPDFYIIILSNADGRHFREVRNISGNENSIKIDNAQIGSYYQITVYAGSAAGQSKPEYLHREVKPPSGTHVNGTLLWVVLAPIISFIIIIATVAFLYHRHEKLKLYKRRCRYFEELEQKAPKETDSGSSFTISPEDDVFEVIPDKLILYEVLGEGAFGVVRKGWLPDQKRDVAVKMLKEEPSAEEVKQFRQEIDMMKSVGGHAHIVSLIGCCTRPSATMMLVVEFCARGDLQNYLRLAWDELSSKIHRKPLTSSVMNLNNCDADGNAIEEIKYAELLSSENSECETSVIISQPNLIVNRLYDLQHDAEGKTEASEDNEITAVDLLSFGRQIAMGMEFLSSNRVVHRDLAARNVLVCADKTVKIADFGLSRDIYQENMYRKTGTGKLPIKWMALESLTHQVYTTQSDVWSFGILMWEIVTLGSNPYPSVPTGHLLKLLMSGYRMERPNNCSEDLYALMIGCWRTRPKDRPTFGEIRLRLDNLLHGMCSHAYLSLDVFDSKDTEDITKLSLDQISKSSGTSHPNSGSALTDSERYVRPIALGKSKPSIISARPNHYSFQPPSVFGSYPNSLTSMRMQDDNINGFKTQNLLTAKYPPIITDDTFLMTKLSNVDMDLTNGNSPLPAAYSNKVTNKNSRSPQNPYCLKQFAGH